MVALERSEIVAAIERVARIALDRLPGLPGFVVAAVQPLPLAEVLLKIRLDVPGARFVDDPRPHRRLVGRDDERTAGARDDVLVAARLGVSPHELRDVAASRRDLRVGRRAPPCLGDLLLRHAQREEVGPQRDGLRAPLDAEADRAVGEGEFRRGLLGPLEHVGEVEEGALRGRDLFARPRMGAGRRRSFGLDLEAGVMGGEGGCHADPYAALTAAASTTLHAEISREVPSEPWSAGPLPTRFLTVSDGWGYDRAP